MEQELPFQQKLVSLWEQGSRHVALSFLRRALSSENTLSEVIEALNFSGVKAYLDSITLSEVLSDEDENGLKSSSSKTKRRRRSGEEVKQIKRHLLDCLQNEASGIMDSTSLRQALEEFEYKMDTVRLNTILKELEKEGVVADMGGKPKNWRLLTVGRRSAEPMVIRKKQVS